MKIIEDFDFYKKGNATFEKKFGISSSEFESARTIVKKVRNFMDKSIYKHCFKEVYIVLTDLPVSSEFAEVDGDPYTKKLFIHLNLVSLITEYHLKDNVLCDILFEEKPSLTDFIAFFLFHEMGHVLHFQAESTGKISLYEKMEIFHRKYKDVYEHFYEKYQDILHLEQDKTLQKAYRKLYPEKIADTYAYRLLEEFKKNKS